MFKVHVVCLVFYKLGLNISIIEFETTRLLSQFLLLVFYERKTILEILHIKDFKFYVTYTPMV